jgi:hypothetical protein
MSDDYPVRFVAFIDILGFRELIATLDRDPSLLGSVRDLLSEVHQPPEKLGNIFSGSDFRSATISDAVALSAANTPTGLQHIIAVTEILTNKLLRLGYFVRGAVVKDRLFHNDKMVLGAGLVRAYTFESAVAGYPRIMLTREVVHDIDNFVREKAFHDFYSDCVRRSDDGPQYVHSLRMYPRRLKDLDGQARINLLGQLLLIRDKIQLRLDEAVDNPGHYKKVHWFAAYWNDVFYGIEGLPKIEAPGLEIAIVI